MKKLLINVCLLSTFTCMLAACGDAPDDSTEMAEDANEQKLDNKMEDDAEFVVKAVDGGIMEIKLAELAQTKATTAEAKEFAAMMITDHSKANDELKAVATQKNITVPTSLSEDKQGKYDDMNKKSGIDFDKAYISYMVKDHKDDIDLFEKEAKKGNDADLKTWASGKLPTLEHHLQMAQRADSMLSKR